MAANVEQHRVPRVLLKRFATKLKGGRIFQFDKQTLIGEWLPIKKVAREPYAYNLSFDSNPEKPLIDGLFQRLENELDFIIQCVIEKKPFPQQYLTPFYLFVATQILRTTKGVAWWDSPLFLALQNRAKEEPEALIKEMQDEFALMPAELKRFVPTEAEIAQQVAELPNKVKPTKDEHLAAIYYVTPRIAANMARRKWASVPIEDESLSLICSDAPAVLVYLGNEPGKYYGFHDKNTVVQLPVSSQYLALGVLEGFQLARCSMDQFVGGVNGHTFREAHRYIYARTDKFSFDISGKRTSLTEYIDSQRTARKTDNHGK